MNEHTRKEEKEEMAKIADYAKRQEEERRMMDNLNGTSKPIKSNQETMDGIDENLRVEEMARIARSQEEITMAELNGTFNYTDNVSEKVGHKRR